MINLKFFKTFSIVVVWRPLSLSTKPVVWQLHSNSNMPPKGGTKRKAPGGSDGTSTPHIPTLAEQLSYLHSPRPFKNPNYTKNVNRRAKNLKTVLAQERERERAERERKRLERLEGTSMDIDGEEEEMPTYTSIEAPPSVLPQRHYCDITGLEAPYTDPTTGLRYHNKSVYDVIKGLSASSAKDYLAARGVSSIVK
ncbi:Chromatin-remodeling complex subunit ies6 [Hypsizygus marmoreus]|uniref:Chromatin-remodeling complex subunit ies6 n=1 Tax=Hypsizygus marmoreus TaxID=39966 RepID=A0A369KAV6_HYPMA|nr:Chromatin-remodeling complex subunit ies6 [Hypsizygus marmoreus]